MANDSDLEKTEPASPRRMEKAREDGDVPRSRELATCTILMAAGAGTWMLSDRLIQAISTSLATGLTFSREQAFDSNLLLMAQGARINQLLLAFSPLAGLLMLVALASPVLIGGWLFSTKALQPKFSRLNPLSGLGNMVSKRAGVELFKALGKTIVVGTVAWIVVAQQLDAVMALSAESLHSAIAHVGRLLLVTFIAIAASLVLITLIDAPFQMWQHANKLKMSKEEVRQEAKESDGNPEIKAKIRQQQREMARRRMMTEIPGADVIVTNPTHFAVVLKYAEGAMSAPRVVAKGTDAVAAKIREIAAEHKVPLMEAPSLARALHAHTELGEEIPHALYTAVAEVLAYIFQLRTYRSQGGRYPDRPGNLDVPPEMDPLNPAATKGATA